MFEVIMRLSIATLKLAPRLPSTVAVSSFPTIQDAADAARDLVQQGPSTSDLCGTFARHSLTDVLRTGVGLACIELLDDVMIKCINKKGGGIVWEEKPRFVSSCKSGHRH
jgi:D-lactate dehydrogenase (cytochrome)